MDERRARRSREKLRHADEALADVEAWLPDGAADRKTRRAVYKAFQEACEAATDLAAMVIVDAGHNAMDDYVDFDEAAKAGLRITEHLDALKEATGVRNRLIHEYNGLDDRIALEAIPDLVPALRAFLEEVEGWSTSRR